MTRLRNNTERTAKMIDALWQSPQTYEQLADISGLNKPAVATWVKSMRAARMMYVAKWAPDVRGRAFKPVFGWGSKTDAARSVHTGAERMAAFRGRNKKVGV